MMKPIRFCCCDKQRSLEIEKQEFDIGDTIIIPCPERGRIAAPHHTIITITGYDDDDLLYEISYSGKKLTY